MGGNSIDRHDAFQTHCHEREALDSLPFKRTKVGKWKARCQTNLSMDSRNCPESLIFSGFGAD
jgi:hypothetical protein